MYLARRLGITAADALDRVRRALPETHPNPAFIELLRAHDQRTGGR